MKVKHFFYRTSTALCKRLINTKPLERNIQWIQPTGMETKVAVYNPMTKCKTVLILNNKNIATWYMCGPTLYDSAHIGHASTYVRFDIIHRILNDFFNIDVIKVMGLTDIDDKIIKRSAETGQDWRQLTQFYEKEFFEDMHLLNIIHPYLRCRVSDYIPQIIEFISQILQKNYAYVTNDGSLYFDTLNYKLYGKLSRPEIDSNHPGKKSSLDFALWKASKNGEPWWESPWGHGRPGWHIECSTIASTVFGNNIDIHSGGIDLVFPHHENEEAQSCCYHDEPQWINYWLHTGHLHLKDNEKMSKSLKNTISIRTLLKKYTANEFRMFCLLTNYRSGIEFSETVMQNAVSLLKKIEHFVQDCDNYVAGRISTGRVDESLLLSVLYDTKKKVLIALGDDFDTPKAMHEIFNLVTVGNKMLHQCQDGYQIRNTVSVAAVSKYISSVLSKFGITSFAYAQENQHITNIVQNFVNFRSFVRNKALSKENKDIDLLKACDNVRKDLSIYGIDVKDYKGTSTWTLVKK